MRIGLVALALALLAPAVAEAGTYDVVSCRAPGAGGVNHAWEAAYEAFGPPDPGVANMFDVIAECPGSRTFLLARSKALQGVAAYWSHTAYFRFKAPPGTTISRLRIWRHGQTVKEGELEEWDILGRTDDGDLVLEKCIHGPGQGVCNTGAPEPLDGTGVSSASLATHDVNTPYVDLGVACNPNGFKSCNTADGNGYPLASFNLWGSVVTIRDDARPSLQAGGAMWRAGWHRPAEPLSYDASDNAGIKSVEARVGGAVATARGTCDFRREAPCSGRLRGPLVLGRPPDGRQQARLSAVDAAGNVTTAVRTVLIDGTPPRVDLRRPQKRTIVVRVSDPASGFAGGRILVRQGSAEPYRALPTTFSRGAIRAPLDRGNPRRTDVRVIVRDKVGNQANGVPARFRITSARSGKRKLKLRRGRVRARFGSPVTLRGQLTLSAGQPLAGVPIRISSRPRGRRGARAAEVSGTTGPTGRFALTVGRGVSRNLLLSYAGVRDSLPAARHLGLRVPATSSIRASRKRLSGAGTARFRGRVRDAGAGLVVVLQGYEGGRWRTFADTRTHRRGKWRAGYRFSGRPGRYPIRVRIRRQTGLPYETGYSRKLVVRVS